MGVLGNTILLALGLVLLVRGADAFVDGASGIAARLGMPPLVIGLTVVAIGTSAPEAAISISSATAGSDGLAIANVFGSNIMNTLVILGVTALISELPVQAMTFKFEIPFVFVITALLLVLGVSDGELSGTDATVLLACLGLYLAYMVYLVRSRPDGEEGHEAKRMPLRRLLLLVAAGVVAIALGSKLAVDGATNLARFFGMPDRVIGLTIVAVGTSLPEFVTTITAARKGEVDIAIGDIVGSSVFNILFVLGVSAVITPLPFSRELFIDGAVAMLAAALLWLACRRTRSLRHTWGIAMLVFYAFYLAFLLMS